MPTLEELGFPPDMILPKANLEGIGRSHPDIDFLNMCREHRGHLPSDPIPYCERRLELSPQILGETLFVAFVSSQVETQQEEVNQYLEVLNKVEALIIEIKEEISEAYNPSCSA